MGQELIKKLLEAEKQAEDIIANAKKARLNKLRQAKDKAEEELVVFRREQDAKFDKEMKSKSISDSNSASDANSRRELEMVKADYNANKQSTIDYVCQKVLDVKIALNDTQVQALKQGIV